MVRRMTQGLYSAIAQRWDAAPDAVAIVEDSRSWTRGELKELVGRMHGALQGLGAQPGAPVCVVVEKSVPAYAAYLACLRGGYAFFPINAGYTDAEIEYLIGDAGPKVVVGDPERAKGLGKLAADRGAAFTTLAGDGTGALIDLADKATAPEPYPCTDKSWAALLYTSGTTGKPKGAVLSHGALEANVRALIEAWKFTEADVILHVLPIFHVHGLFVAGNIAMLSGARLIWRRAFDPVDVLRRLKDATAFMGVPTLYTRLLAQPGLNPEAVKSIRLFVSGSAPLDPVTFTAFRERTGHSILERYGMTETNMLVSNPYDGERLAGSVGYPLPGVQIRLRADGGGEPKTGEVGVVQVKGPNVFQGYLNAPEKTAAAFTEDGYFVTGDLGYLTEDGRLYLVGRQSDMIISGGYNVYPTEVEAALIDLDGVAEAAVFGLKHPDFGEAVAAAVAPRPGSTLAEADLIKACRKRLAGYKTPKRVFLLEALPRNAMGKTDRKALRAQFAGAFDS